MEPQKSLNSETNPKEKEKSWSITLPNFKLYYKTTVIKAVWHLKKNRHTAEWNRIESPLVYGQLIFNKEAKNIQ